MLISASAARHLVARLLSGLAALLLALAIVAADGLLYLRHQGDELLSVQTGSMVPTLRPGDAVIVVPAEAGHLRPGYVVSYRSLTRNGLIVTHRLVGIHSGSTGVNLITEGDAVSVPDPPFPAKQLIGRVVAVAPGLGRWLDCLRRPLGLAMAVYLPAAALLVAEIRRLANRRW